MQEFAGKHNIRDADTLAQMVTMTAGLIGRRLMYSQLIADNGLDSSSTVFPEVRRLKSNEINNLGVVQSDHSLECSGKF